MSRNKPSRYKGGQGSEAASACRYQERAPPHSSLCGRQGAQTATSIRRSDSFVAKASHGRSHPSCDLSAPQESLCPATQTHPLPTERSKRKNVVKRREGIGLGWAEAGSSPACYRKNLRSVLHEPLSRSAYTACMGSRPKPLRPTALRLTKTSAMTRRKRKMWNAMKTHIAARLKYIVACSAWLYKLHR